MACDKCGKDVSDARNKWYVCPLHCHIFCTILCRRCVEPFAVQYYSCKSGSSAGTPLGFSPYLFAPGLLSRQ